MVNINTSIPEPSLIIFQLFTFLHRHIRLVRPVGVVFLTERCTLVRNGEVSFVSHGIISTTTLCAMIALTLSSLNGERQWGTVFNKVSV